MSANNLCGWYARDKETFVERMSVVKEGVKLGAKGAPVKEKPVGWKPTRFCLGCCEERTILCVDGIDGEWGRCRICVPPWD